jgi:Protein of unknown function (DUF2934)
VSAVESSRIVLHRGRETADNRLEKRAASEEEGSRLPPTAQQRQQMIAVAAYHRAQRRNFDPGHELEDWLEAEAEVDAQLQAG